MLKGGAVPDKDPFAYGLITYAWVTGLAAWAGFLNFYRRVKEGDAKVFNVFEAIGEMATSSFAGLITFWLCEASEINPLVTASLIAISGHMGSRSLYMLELQVEKHFGKKGRGDGKDS